MNFLRRLQGVGSRLVSPPSRSMLTTRRSGEIGRTLLIVVPLTLLIWAFAEKAQTRDDPAGVSVSLALATSDSSLIASVAEGVDSKVQIGMSGPLGQINLLKQKLESPSANGQLLVPLLQSDAAVGEKNIDVVRTLMNDPRFGNSGVNIRATPAQLPVAVDPIDKRDVAVALPNDLPVTLLNVTFDPPRVTVQGPKRLVTPLGREGAAVRVNLSNVSWSGTERQTIEVPLSLGESKLTSTPSKVKMSYEVGSVVADLTIPAVGILVERPLGEEGKYKVEMRRGVINNVVIRGPGSIVDKYKGDRPNQTLKAVLVVSQDDVGKPNVQRKVEFPYREAGITIVGEPYEVVFNVRDLPNDADR